MITGGRWGFRLEIENNGDSREIVHPVLTDYLPRCLNYAGGATIFLNGRTRGKLPDEINQTGTGAELVWNLLELGPLAPGEKIAIDFDAIAVEPGPNVNEFTVTAHSADDDNVVVSDHDDATVMVVSSQEPVDATSEPEDMPEPEEVLYAYLYIYTECSYLSEECIGCTVTASFYGQDLTGGDYPVTSVVLKVNGQVWHDSGSVSTTLYERTVTQSSGCGQTYNFELTVTNSIGLEGVVTKTIVAEASE